MLWNIMLVHLLGLMSPGPDFFYVTKVAASAGRRSAFYAILGITLGVSFWALAALLGLSVVLHNSPTLYQVLLILGGSYLMWLGSLMLRSNQQVQFEQKSAVLLKEKTTKEAIKEFPRGLLVNLSNAKVVVYFASVLSYYLVSVSGVQAIMLVLVVILLETFIYFYLISLLFSLQPVRRFYTNYSRRIDQIAGLIFASLGVYLFYQGAIALKALA